MWKPVPVSLPKNSLIGRQPGPLAEIAHPHRQDPPGLAAVYAPFPLVPTSPRSAESVPVRIVNTGTVAWPAAGNSAISLTYHLFTTKADPWVPISPFAAGVLTVGHLASTLPHAVLPGKGVTVPASIVAPSTPGSYFLAWDLEVGTGSWLSQQGTLPSVERLQVLKSSETPTPSVPTATPTSEAAENLVYIADTGVPDGTVVSPLQPFEKAWLVFNSGSREWLPGWHLQLQRGHPFGVRSIAVPVTHPCHTANVIAAMRAPLHPGKYTGVWRIVDAQGAPFGQRLTVVVRVQGNPGSRPTPTPVAPPTPVTATPGAPTPTPTPVG
jgi:hypothetical protein